MSCPRLWRSTFSSLRVPNYRLYCVMVRVLTRLGAGLRGGGKNQVTAAA